MIRAPPPELARSALMRRSKPGNLSTNILLPGPVSIRVEAGRAKGWQTALIRVERSSGTIPLESGAIGAAGPAGHPLVCDDGLSSWCDLVGQEQLTGHSFDWANGAIGRSLREAAQSLDHQTVPHAGGCQISKIVDEVAPGIVELTYGRHESHHASDIETVRIDVPATY